MLIIWKCIYFMPHSIYCVNPFFQSDNAIFTPWFKLQISLIHLNTKDQPKQIWPGVDGLWKPFQSKIIFKWLERNLNQAWKKQSSRKDAQALGHASSDPPHLPNSYIHTQLSLTFHSSHLDISWLLIHTCHTGRKVRSVF